MAMGKRGGILLLMPVPVGGLGLAFLMVGLTGLGLTLMARRRR